MISFKCPTCSGEVIVSRTGDVICPYCGSTRTFSDDELKEYRTYRRRMLEYLRDMADTAAHDEERKLLWDTHAETTVFESESGSPISVRYLYESVTDGVRMLSAQSSVIFVYPASLAEKADLALHMQTRLQFPSADIKGLDKCFPALIGSYRLRDGGRLVVYNKPEDFYPLAMFGNLPGVHMAWIISRMENIACVLEYSALTHRGFSEEAFFINPKTHQAILFGGWEKAMPKDNSNRFEDLAAIRTVAKKVIGPDCPRLPEMFRSFLASAPACDAYTDYSAWDRVIEEGLGGHNFTKFNMSEYI